MTPSHSFDDKRNSNDSYNDKFIEYQDTKGITIRDFIGRLFRRKALWWCKGCNAFHAYDEDGIMDCPFGKEE